ncbi:bifunctional [glutamine synthetase] adenylyltransferase/[glutamine synthetase]-adenylyl-L-tyrosine phosphorylase [Methylovirgula sp. 4M-Z18]|nr:bifunctional [glutamine synthetase] adenylyltransferase/[glutamine synthetase]-adenylyl-L-tyrosine phosphorylase [Methylovirgula sp. 4M-Z18]
MALAQRIVAAPKVKRSSLAKRKLRDVLDAGGEIAAPHIEALLLGIADHSPYLWTLIVRDVGRLHGLLHTEPEEKLRAIIADVLKLGLDAASEAALMQGLRKAKQELALLVALCDLGGVWGLTQVTGALSSFADACVAASLRFLLIEAQRAGAVHLAEPDNPERGCGIFVLAMGKHGARELNYSSDIDLIVLFDLASPAFAPGAEPGAQIVRMTKRLVKHLQERTSDGYVFRVDLRLRPDPGATAVAISITTAFSYYETLGQNWERAALIKARPVAGDIPVGQSFLAELRPFIWRKYFDYAAIADIHAMKRQIHAFKGHGEVAVAGHDLKLGRGGIREIEFFVQTQQLIFGGRRPDLRGAQTLSMLRALHDDGWVSEKAVRDLSDAYDFLRRLEHRRQMIDDEQTQRLPADDADLKSFAAFCGYARFESFRKVLLHHLRHVEMHYARLFEHAPELATEVGNLVFTGVTDDPETLKTLRDMDFREPEAAAETVRGWHFGRRVAVRSARAREVLTELIPSLLKSFSDSGDPDAALKAFDAALEKMPAAIELFAILKSNGAIRQLFADILGAAPRLAQAVIARPHLLDAAIDPDQLSPRADDAAFDARVNASLQNVAGEEFLDKARDLGREEIFLISVRLLGGVFDAKLAGSAYSALAASLVRATLAQVQAAMAQEYGTVPSSACAVFAMGKLGSQEMTAASDLDLIVIYDFDSERPDSDGAKSLHAVQYFTRLTQRLLSSISAPTRRGRLYEVDMRLRPSGRKGPLATQIDGFADYQSKEAENWEHMALTRARFVAGDAALAKRVEAVIETAIGQDKDVAHIKRDVREMRALIAQEKGEADPWDLKLASGGIIDLEFLSQYHCLAFSAAHPSLLKRRTDLVLAEAAQLGLLAPDDAAILQEAYDLYTCATQMMRLTVDGAFDPHKVPNAVKQQIARGCALPDFRTLDKQLTGLRREVRRIFKHVLQ